MFNFKRKPIHDEGQLEFAFGDVPNVVCPMACFSSECTAYSTTEAEKCRQAHDQQDAKMNFDPLGR